MSKLDRSNSIKVGKDLESTQKLTQLDKVQKRHSCIDDTTIVIMIRVAVQKIKIVCIHPQNDSYPIFTAKANGMYMDFNMHQDHDHYTGSLGNFKVCDNTSYPYTLDPTVNYPKGSPTDSQLIFGFSNLKNDKAVKFDMIQFHFPKDFTCPLQHDMK